MSEILMIKSKILIDVSDISDVRGLEYKGKHDDDLSGKYVVRVFSKTPFIDLVFDSIEDAQKMYKDIFKSRHVVNINEMRYGK